MTRLSLVTAATFLRLAGAKKSGGGGHLPSRWPAVCGEPRYDRRGGAVRRGQVNGSGFRLRCRRRSLGGCRVRRTRGVGCGVAGPAADAGGADRLHPVDAGGRRRHRAVGAAGPGTDVDLDDVEDLRGGGGRVAAQDGVVGDRLVRGGPPGQGDRIVYPGGLEVGGLGRGISAGGSLSPEGLPGPGPGAPSGSPAGQRSGPPTR